VKMLNFAIYLMSEYVPADEVMTSDLFEEGFYSDIIALSGPRSGDYRISVADEYAVLWIHRNRELHLETGNMLLETSVFHLQTFSDVFGVTLILNNIETQPFMPIKLEPGKGAEYG